MAAEKRLKKELGDIKSNLSTGCDVSVIDDNLFHWKASITGPDDSPYSGGFFHIDIVFPADYPFRQPKINFTTKIYHVNISDSGIICMEFLMEKWQPINLVSNVLTNIRLQLSSVEEDNAINMEAAGVYKADNEAYYQTARDWTKLYASKSQTTQHIQ
ncbi:hypothetical protein VHEMI02242 [[Torrubiella] hemipterigena]|uniref:E2 ubiquitin-conjugating enzyme n=1 Tax=[Torrubiella] hemipterigena TaxID=1531966 RepID=A0A0A1TA02_9HYPO|nr:hypothetical protein VHEMI02242 [[Torrubiella] hemipterigena]